MRRAALLDRLHEVRDQRRVQVCRRRMDFGPRHLPPRRQAAGASVPPLPQPSFADAPGSPGDPPRRRRRL